MERNLELCYRSLTTLNVSAIIPNWSPYLTLSLSLSLSLSLMTDGPYETYLFFQFRKQLLYIYIYIYMDDWIDVYVCLYMY